MRKPFIAGNWKMNKLSADASAYGSLFAEALRRAGADLDKVDTGLFVPFVHLTAVREACAGTGIAVGAQNMHYKESGAYTGEISVSMLADMGIGHVIIGHSERRQYFGETSGECAKKVKAAVAAGIRPVLCVGESLEDREAGQYREVVREMLLGSLEDVTAEETKNTVIAYEPVWAIGTGKTATSDQAQEMAAFIRSVLAERYGAVAEDVIIQYGGSVKPSNVAELMAKPDIDGALVGGASLNPEDFAVLVAFDDSVRK